MQRAFNSDRQHVVRITPHVLRHTYCTRLSEANVPPKVIQYLMGHANISVQQIYTDIEFGTVLREMKAAALVG